MRRVRKEFYFRSVDRRWRKELRVATGRVLVFTPYLTSRTAELVLESAAPSRCEVHTVLSLEAFASGASSIRTLRNLMSRGYPIFEIPNLHAKVIIVEGRFASIGSQNLTSRGVTNLEATMVVSAPSKVSAMLEAVQPWLAARKRVTPEMLDELQRHILTLARAFRRARRQATEIECSARAAAERQSREAEANKARSALVNLVGSREVSEETARYFVRRATWWLTHRDGPVRARGFARRVYGSNGDWRLQLGANTFLVGRAIQRCRRTIESVLDDAAAGNRRTRQDLARRLRLNVRGAVQNARGEEYNGLYPIDRDGRMRFGAQAIDTNDFVGAFLRALPAGTLFTEDGG